MRCKKFTLLNPTKTIRSNLTRLKLSTVLFLGLGLTSLQAQTMYVKESGGTQTAYSLSNIRKMTFSAGNLTVFKTNNSTGVYALNTLRFLNFKDISTNIGELNYTENKSLLTYPNPVINELKIDLRGMSNLNSTLTILNIEGRVLKSQSVIDSGIVTLDMSQFAKGIYLCQYSNGIEIKTVKIIKK
jgi:hypothetical protein